MISQKDATMTEAILLALWIGTTFFFTIRETRKKEDLERHEWWLSDLKDCLHSIESEFRRNCEEIIKNAFSEYNERLSRFDSTVSDFARNFQIQELFDVIHRHENSIDELKKQYKDDLYDKTVALKRITVRTIPEHLVKEYEISISNTADIYRNFSNLMHDHLIEIKQRRR